jgi:hypothetical protein
MIPRVHTTENGTWEWPAQLSFPSTSISSASLPFTSSLFYRLLGHNAPEDTQLFSGRFTHFCELLGSLLLAMEQALSH